MPNKNEKTDRNAEMKRLRYEEFWTEQKIGNHFGVTRERVRQVVGNSGHISAPFRREYILDHPYASATELAERFEITPEHVRRIRERGNVYYRREEGDWKYEKAQWVEWVSDRLSTLGIENAILSDFSIELWDGNIWVAVSKIRPLAPSHRGWPYASFHIGKGFSKSDFVIAVIEDTPTAYVIPTLVFPPIMDRNRSQFRLQEVYGRPGKYTQYREAWHLLND